MSSPTNEKREANNSNLNNEEDLLVRLWEEVRKVYDPEIGFSIVDLGLVYDIWLENQKAYIKMTLTSMGCPAGPYLEHQVKEYCKQIPGIEDVIVQITFDPPWNPREMASEEIRMLMGIY
ncbi:MAG: metal-sulfur cluster assembly factor [Leptospiraceae bacterium]|nr:metal-sulfur cluster assembly factor [Leptospiraceae bacterium]MDW7976266.1 metal-sulfur cluster assembly factor [Leptospiraceae bacterium]